MRQSVLLQTSTGQGLQKSHKAPVGAFRRHTLLWPHWMPLCGAKADCGNSLYKTWPLILSFKTTNWPSMNARQLHIQTLDEK